MLKENEQIIYPGHGLAIVKELVVVGDEEFVKLEFPYKKHMQILVPVAGLECAGIRQVASAKAVEKVIDLLTESSDKNVEELVSGGRQTWKKKQRVYRETIACGKLVEIASMYRDLYRSAQIKELPFGEKDLLCKVEALVCQEIYAAKKITYDMDLFNKKLRKVVTKQLGPKDLASEQ